MAVSLVASKDEGGKQIEASQGHNERLLIPIEL